MRLAQYGDEEKSRRNQETTVTETVTTQLAVVPAVVEEVSKPTIDTSHWRPNLLHDHEAGYVEPSGYLYFTGDDELLYSHKDLWLDGGNDCRLALTIPLELADGYLVMAYAGEKAVKIPLSEIYARGENNPMSTTPTNP